ncbi:MAG: hypothetical protein LBT81_02885 [Helicobacteraceae bacterium]|nr:hypothetical protein [Helicobacteraceae bacterium]
MASITPPALDSANLADRYTFGLVDFDIDSGEIGAIYFNLKFLLNLTYGLWFIHAAISAVYLLCEMEGCGFWEIQPTVLSLLLARYFLRH